jgi:hypothetical protein
MLSFLASPLQLAMQLSAGGAAAAGLVDLLVPLLLLLVRLVVEVVPFQPLALLVPLLQVLLVLTELLVSPLQLAMQLFLPEMLQLVGLVDLFVPLLLLLVRQVVEVVAFQPLALLLPMLRSRCSLEPPAHRTLLKPLQP